MIGQLMELGPRCLGNSDGWKQIEPWVGMSRAYSGTKMIMKAMTIRSAFKARISSSTSASV